MNGSDLSTTWYKRSMKTMQLMSNVGAGLAVFLFLSTLVIELVVR